MFVSVPDYLHDLWTVIYALMATKPSSWFKENYFKMSNADLYDTLCYVLQMTKRHESCHGTLGGIKTQIAVDAIW